MNFKHLHYFWTVARTGGVAAAAQRLHVTPQTISGQVRLLEESLGNERQEGTMEVRCHFCGTSYLFPEGDLSGTGLGTTVPAEGNKGE